MARENDHARMLPDEVRRGLQMAGGGEGLSINEFARICGIKRTRVQRFLMPIEAANSEEPPFLLTLILAYLQSPEGLAEARAISAAKQIDPAEMEEA